MFGPIPGPMFERLHQAQVPSPWHLHLPLGCRGSLIACPTTLLVVVSHCPLLTHASISPSACLSAY